MPRSSGRRTVRAAQTGFPTARYGIGPVASPNLPATGIGGKLAAGYARSHLARGANRQRMPPLRSLSAITNGAPSVRVGAAPRCNCRDTSTFRERVAKLGLELRERVGTIYTR